MSKNSKSENTKLKIVEVPIEQLKELPGNPRHWSDKSIADLDTSVERFGVVEALVVNFDYTVLSGNFRLHILKKRGYKTVPCVFVDIRDEEKAKELALRLNKNTGEWSFELLAEFDPSLLEMVGFSSEEMDEIFNIDLDEPENFDLEKELAKLDIKVIKAQKGDLYRLGESKLLVGDSTVEADILKLMGGENADMVLTDPPYRLSYLKGGIRHGKPVEGFGAKRNRKYLETDELPIDFTEKWVSNVAKVAKPDFSIIVFELWRNLREVWGELEKHWKVQNMIVWHVPTRHQGFAAKRKFFSKHDIAMVAGSGTVPFNHELEPEGLQEEYETALYATQGKPHWENYERGKRLQPTDFIDHPASDEKSSGQGVVFGTKPIPVLLPYLKVLTKRGDLVLECFGGSGSTLIAAEKLKRRCNVCELSPVYAEVIMARWEKLTGLKRKKIDE